jgi:uncharacterized protein (DUF697 family)
MPKDSQTTNIMAENTIKNHVIASMGLSLVPIPLVDISALTITQLNMLQKLCRHYEVPFEEDDLKPLLAALVSGAAPVLGMVTISSLVKSIPGIGTLAGTASLSILAGAVTYAAGQTFVLHFSAGGTLQDLDMQQAKTFFKQELKNGKQFVQNLKDEIKAAKEAATEQNSTSSDKPGNTH